MPRKSPWAYKVSRKEREVEIALCSRWIDLYDTLAPLLAAGRLGPHLDRDSENRLVDLMTATSEAAAAFGLTAQDAADMLAAYDYAETEIPGWLADVKGRWRAGDKILDARVSVYGQDWLYPSAKWKRDRARFMAQRSAARRAIEDGRAV